MRDNNQIFGETDEESLEGRLDMQRGTRFVIGGEKYVPLIGEKPHKLMHTDRGQAIRHYHTVARQDYLTQGEQSATIWELEMAQGHILSFKPYKTYNLSAQEESFF